ncbi:MAG: lipopolysaccharide transport periplasmic protein LptA [Betaproteobacteria bacterium]
MIPACPLPADPPAPPSPRRVVRRLALAAAMAVALVPVARAETNDREKPINYSADTGDVNYQTKVGTLTGSVIITQGTLSIRADKIVFRQNPDNSMSASAYGNPVSFRQKRDGSDEYYEGYAQRAEYDGAKELLELFDRALLRRGQDDIRSNYISYNAATELFKAEGRTETKAVPGDPGPGARVRGTFQPKSDSPFPGSGKGKDPAAKPAPAPPPAATLKPAGEIAAPAAK